VKQVEVDIQMRRIEIQLFNYINLAHQHRHTGKFL